MQLNELIAKAQLVMDSDGNRKAVQLDYETWEELLKLLGGANSQSGEWVTQALNEVCLKEDTGLDPVLAAMQWASLPREDW